MSILDDITTAARGRLAGPLPQLPARLDDAVDRWWGLPPRVRVGVGVFACVLLACLPLVRTARSAWGPPQGVWVAVADMPAGTTLGPGTVTRAQRPAELVPGDAMTDPVGVLTMPVLAGTVLTDRHRAESLATMLGPREVAVPVPADLQPDIEPGTVVDLLTAGFDGTGRTLVVAGRVLQVTGPFLWIAVPDRAAADAAAAAADQRLVLAIRRDSRVTGPDGRDG